MAMGEFTALHWYDYILLGVVVLIPALLLWRAWAIRRQKDLETSLARLAVMALVGGIGWFMATWPFSWIFADYDDLLFGLPFELVRTRWLYHNTLGLPYIFDSWVFLVVPLFLFVLGLIGFALAKFRLDIAIFALAVASFIALGLFAATSNIPIIALAAPYAKGVPLYPGSEDAKVNRFGNGINSQAISFVAPAEPDVVWPFYERELPKGGWHLVTEYRSPYLLRFERSETEKGLSWRFGLFMNSYLTGGTIKKAYVSVSIYRHPDMQKLPVHPGAHDAKTTEERLPNGVEQLTTTYMVSAQPKEVESWYRSIVLNDKAWKEETESEHVREGLLFRFNRAGTLWIRDGVELTVIARQDPSGQTQVELRGVDYAATKWFPGIGQYLPPD